MSELKMRLTPKFERELMQLMRARGIKSKSKAVRIAVEEALTSASTAPTVTWSELIGIAVQDRTNSCDIGLTEDQLW